MTRLRSPFSSLLFVAFIFMAVFLANPALSAEPVGKIAQVAGTVEILRNGVPPAVAAAAGTPVFQNDLVRTKSDSKAEITFNDGNILRLGQRTRIDISEYISGNRAKVALAGGKVQAHVDDKIIKRVDISGAKGRFEIHTPNAVAAVRGTIFYTSYEGDTTEVLVEEGTVYAYNQAHPDDGVDVTEGNETTIQGDNPPEEPRPFTDEDLSGFQDDVLIGDTGGDYLWDLPEDFVLGEEFTGPSGESTPPPPPLIPVSDIIDITETQTPVSWSASLDIGSGDWQTGFGSFGGEDLLWEGTLEGTMEGSGVWPGESSFTLSGIYDNPSGSTLWGTFMSGQISNQGEFIGGIGGTALGGLLESIGVGLYIRPNTSSSTDYTMGYFTSSGTGSYAAGTLQLAGTITATDMGETSYSPAELSEAYDSREASSVSFLGDMVWGRTYHQIITPLDQTSWGLMLFDMGGEYEVVPTSSWSIMVGEWDGYYDEYESWNPYVWLMTMTGDSGWSGNKLAADITGRYMTLDEVGTFEGSLLGSYGGGSWQALGWALQDRTPLAWSGEAPSNYYYYYCSDGCGLDYGGWVNVIFGTTSSPFEAEGAVNLYLMSEFREESVGITWLGDIYSPGGIGEFALDGGGDFIGGGELVAAQTYWEGWIGGVTPGNSIKGMLVALYVAESGNAGILSGGFEGDNYPDILMWAAEGSLAASPKASIDPFSFGINYAYPYGYGYGTFIGDGTEGTGDIETGDDIYWIGSSYTYWIEHGVEGEVSEPWGIFKLELGGDYYNPDAETGFTLTLGGDNWKGWSYWLAEVDGTVNEDQTMEGAVAGSFLTEYSRGTITGNLLGSYDTDYEGTWEAVALGEFEETPLALSSGVNGDFYYYNSDAQWLEYVGYISGIAGAITSPFETPGTESALYLMGNAFPDGAVTWMSYFSSESDSPWWDGWISGVNTNGTVKGMIKAIYIDNNEYAGILSGSFEGTNYPDIYMWEAIGSLTANQKTTGSGFGEVNWGEPYGAGYGAFTGGTGSIGVSDLGLDGSYTVWLPIYDGVEDWVDEPWGIFKLEFGGDYYDKPEGETGFTLTLGGDNWKGWSYWLARIDGSSGGDQTMEGTIEGSFLTEYARGTITGNLLGSYDTVYEGTWEAVALGEFEETQTIAWSLGVYGDFYYYYSDGPWLASSGWIYSIAGATTSPFETPGEPATLYLMGEALFETSGAFTWMSYFADYYSSEEAHDWDGWMSGVNTGDAVKGMIKALYVDDSGNAGILSGDFTGTNYPDIGIWEASGSLTANQKTTDLFNFDVNWGYPYGVGYGAFAGGTGYIEAGDEISNLGPDGSYTWWLYRYDGVEDWVDEPWGIFKLELGGDYYDKPEGDDTGVIGFTLALGGDGWKEDWGNYWFMEATGTANEDRSLEGAITGSYLTPTALGTITGGLLGSYDTVNPGTWEAVALGEFEETSLAFGGELTWAGNWSLGPYYTIFGDYYGNFDYILDIEGLWGTTSSPWGGSAVEVVYQGVMYSLWDYELSEGELPALLLWNNDVYHHGYPDSGFVDGSGFHGFIGGALLYREMDGMLVGLYTDPSGNAGLVRSDVSGTLYRGFLEEDYESPFFATGTWELAQMASGVASFSTVTKSGMTAYVPARFGETDLVIYGSEYLGWTRFLPDTNWGVYDLILYGYPSNEGGFDEPGEITEWSGQIEGYGTFGQSGAELDYYGYYSANIAGTWENDKITGQSAGGYATDYGTTGIIVGETRGTFDAGSSTWQAIQMGAFMETNTFLAMTATDLGKEALQKLNIPSVEVGSVDLSGYWEEVEIGSIDVSMNGVKFFAPITGARPAIWATSDVGGTYTGDPSTADVLLGNGGTFNANFRFDQWGESSWRATIGNGSGSIDGGGSNVQNIEFQGLAAGTTYESTFSGTAAGAAK